MFELCLMASHGYPSGLATVFNPEQGFRKDLHNFFQYHSSNQDPVNSHSISLRLLRKEEWRSTGALLDCYRFANPTSRRPKLLMFEVHRSLADTHLESLLLGFGIVEQYTRQEKMLKLLASGSIKVEDDSLDSSMLCDLMGPQQPLTFCSKWFFSDAESQQSLIYPIREFYFNEPLFDLVGNRKSFRESIYHPTVNEMSDGLPIFPEVYFSRSTSKSSKQTMLVPYFERRRRGHCNTDSPKLATNKVVAPLKSHERVKAKTSKKRKCSSKTGKERDVSCDTYLHACESLLSIIIDRKQQDRNAITSLKKSGPQLTHFLTRFSASIAGTGIAVVLSVVCRVVCNQVPFSGSKVLNTGFGLGLVWLSWSINQLRDTVISISKSSGKLSSKDDEMMDRLNRDWSGIYFRAAAVMAVAVLWLA